MMIQMMVLWCSGALVRCEKQQKLNWDMFELLIRETVSQGVEIRKCIIPSCVSLSAWVIRKNNINYMLLSPEQSIYCLYTSSGAWRELR